jgi:hypothetical protein
MKPFTRSLTIFALTAPRVVVRPLAWKRVLKRATSLRPHAVLACSPLLLCLVASAAHTQQQTAELRMSSSSLPDAPLPQSDSLSSAEQASSAEGVASVSGVVLDESGAAIPNA